MSAPVKNGDWVCTGPGRFQGTAEDVKDGILTIRLDPNHGHFRDTILSRTNETLLVRDDAIKDAERDIESSSRDARTADKQIRLAQQRKREAQARLREARVELRQARRLPVRSPYARGTS